MKKQLFFLACLSILFSCSKKNNSTSTNPTTSSFPNSISFTINNTSYKVDGHDNSEIIAGSNAIVVDVDTYKDIDSATVNFLVYTSGTAPSFTTNFSAKGSLNGLGTMKVSKYGTFTENFSGGMTYDVVGGSINIAKNDNTSANGTISLNLENTTGTKTITGSFNVTEKDN